MMLYDIFYWGHAMDSNRPLPEKPVAGMKYAKNTNWDRHTMVPKNGEWVRQVRTEEED